ncbi:integrase [Stutzerimonas zhaodongensis]|uniref:Integrase n=1 Tax=Stutzerimonas zhaodongensis TaxID=1176257 RepID=A0A365PR81_9GAMM|nr:Mu transposase C-terminal domain-containing protein [Stutzerimonas zhaodongensis]RBA54697.1 integrase [Stutzerimonas zhaodongensis]
MPTVDIKEGQIVVANGRMCKVSAILPSGRLEVVSQIENKRFAVPIEEVEFIPIADVNGVAVIPPELDELVNKAPEQEVILASERFNVIRDYLEKRLILEEALQKLNMGKSNFFRLVKQYDERIGFHSMLRQRRGVAKNSTRLPEEIDQIIETSIDEVYLGKAASISRVWQDVEAKCITAGFPVPSHTAVRNRLRMRKKRELHGKKHGLESAAQKYDAKTGLLVVNRPLEWVQMDHTLVDIILVDNDKRLPLGRPWLTVLIDLYTRVILGYYLALHHPSALSVSCAIAHAVLPKFSFLGRLGVEGDKYPFYGVPEVLHMDNAKEFKSVKFEAACIRNDITPKWRPLGRKHYGGHVERIIGTLMTDKVHFLPGTTYSNTVMRRGTDSDLTSALTFKEFTKWFAKEVCIYHGRKHSQLGCSPAVKWKTFFGHDARPALVSNPQKFRIDFMPEELRCITREGIKFKNNWYWNGVLNAHVGVGKVMIKYDPFSLKTIWARLDDEYIPVNFSDVTRPDLSIEDHIVDKLQNRSNKRVPDGGLEDHSLAAFVNENKQLIKESQSATRSARKVGAARAEYLAEHKIGMVEERLSGRDVENISRSPDYSKRAAVFKGKSYD